jgi:hypothetical protein
MLRYTVKVLPQTWRLGYAAAPPIMTRKCHNHGKQNIDSLLRTNNIIQHTKDDIIKEIRGSEADQIPPIGGAAAYPNQTTLKKEFETKLRQEIAILHFTSIINSASIFCISVGIIIFQ